MPAAEVLVLVARVPPLLLAGAPILASLVAGCLVARVSLQMAVHLVFLSSAAGRDFAPPKAG